MRVLAYEARRLLGLRSTWLILAATLLAGPALTFLLVRRLTPGPLPVSEATRLVTGAVPLLTLPIAALGAGVLGALASAHEVRCPGLAASQVRYAARLRLLLAKLVVLGTVSALLALASFLVGVLTVRLAAASASPAVRLSVVQLFHAEHRPVPVLATFAALVVAVGWTGILTAALTRSAVAGVLLLCALPMLVDGFAMPRMLDLLNSEGLGWAPTASLQALAAVLLPATLLLAACLLVQLRRRSY
ncbi:hypothetical protein [Kitasatospora kifunensis]|uniref:ABC transporter permease n=1 Tax=Kitasatospora kifunensis TaxID=58351 RepID=A0A7W7VWP9_KITKI|nr:hypothetical protein [Kitasatospora kifunensis]MBB4925666.1 hypothetical protein [Kitasatospora kifunensis]